MSHKVLNVALLVALLLATLVAPTMAGTHALETAIPTYALVVGPSPDDGLPGQPPRFQPLGDTECGSGGGCPL
jgi:hypothetical protein